MKRWCAALCQWWWSWKGNKMDCLIPSSQNRPTTMCCSANKRQGSVRNIGLSRGGQGTARPTLHIAVLGAVLLILCTSGCSIFSGFSSGPLASVTIYNQLPERIEDATTAVFVMNGYRTVGTG